MDSAERGEGAATSLETRALESEQRYKELFEDANDIVYTHDFRGNFTSINPAGERLSGYSGVEALGMNIRDVLAPEDREKAEDMIKAKLGGAPATVYELDLIARDGRRIRVEVSTRLQYRDGKPFQILGIARDLSERRRAEQALRDSEERFRRIFEAMPLGFHLFDLRPDGRLVLTGSNPAADTVLGFPNAPLVGLDLEEAFPYWRGTEVPARYREVAQTGATWHSGAIRYSDERINGTFEIGAFRIGPAGVAVLFQDITGRVMLERKLLQAQKLESVGRLAGGVAHDFNNLLTVINGYSEFLLSRMKPGDAAAAGLEEIRKAGERAAALTRQLLAFSSSQFLEPIRIDLNSAIEDLRTMLERLLGEDIELETELDPSLDAVLADPTQIGQIIMNLAVNARDAMPRGGRLAIHSFNTRVFQEDSAGLVPPGDYVVLAVADSGIGMSEETKARIFEPFFTTKPDGTGLGLSTVYGIVRQSNGWIRVASEAGKGTTMSVYLPAADGTAESAPGRGGPAAAPRGRESILVVEDRPEVLRFVAEVLRSLGYTVHTATRAAEALAWLESRDGCVDLVVTDVVMPGMTGRELAERLTAGGGTKVLLISGYTDDAPAEAAGRVAFLKKPFTPGQLGAKVREMLEA